MAESSPLGFSKCNHVIMGEEWFNVALGILITVFTVLAVLTLDGLWPARPLASVHTAEGLPGCDSGSQRRSQGAGVHFPNVFD